MSNSVLLFINSECDVEVEEVCASFVRIRIVGENGCDLELAGSPEHITGAMVNIATMIAEITRPDPHLC